jgi:hypothetical protein
MARFDSKALTNRQYELARAFEHAGITTYSQAVKALNRGDSQQIEEWKKQLQAKKESK